jgi:hypothetical protein
MPPIILKYPLDPTGVNSNNLVQGELVTLNNKRVRSIAPMYGAFFADSVIIMDMNTNVALIRGVDWYPGELYEVPTALYGKGIYGLIIIANPNISTNVSLQYQAVGGEFSTPADAISQLVNTLNLDNRPVAWPDIIRKPDGYPPSQHLHNAGDIYGFEYLVHALERVRNAIAIGDELANNDIYKYIDTQVATLNASIGNNTASTIGEDEAMFIAGN